MFRHTTDRNARDNIIGDLKKKIQDDKAVLERRVELTEPLPEDDRPYRAKRLSEVFEAMGF
jgi:hypothetical protein